MLINKGIGAWLIKHGYSLWEKGEPYKLELSLVSENTYFLKRTKQQKG
jgi:hypothetical protein